ncbi:hypothetical protein AGABI1DRAFT_111593 [Agaricus bisporus var. burnettii JB137-S8]|uniref:Uncharacterized protein n=1 Tax=Agaricus bisporus var. burnettii (strain JB137-S8 / ATCC MYA-4627 / FGSC 10392) TaxID=597362 RepID=K5XIF7_AGABU|nr:uncharacterized protein AGABI1DRAFT_111593 [Agaricus bisporus var. burnettii JB137-S8]EKM83072.1 hypothetical protein AGABI1DRAFT_111593 [Agaricus bisporus var. burnettii JB137-S8]
MFQSLASIDNLQPEMNEGYSKKIFEWLDVKLGVKHDRGYILFTDPGSGQIGYMSTTLRKILGSSEYKLEGLMS